MPKCIELLPCDWLISNLCCQAIEQVYLIKWPVSVYCMYIYILFWFSRKAINRGINNEHDWQIYVLFYVHRLPQSLIMEGSELHETTLWISICVTHAVIYCLLTVVFITAACLSRLLTPANGCVYDSQSKPHETLTYLYLPMLSSSSF